MKTIHERLLGRKLSTDQQSRVEKLLKAASGTLALLEKEVMQGNTPEGRRLASIAITQLEGAVMFGFKAISRSDTLNGLSALARVAGAKPAKKKAK